MNQPPAIIVQLIHIQGPLKGKIQEFNTSQITIGRHPSCDLQFPTDLVVISRNHANIIREGNRFKIIDQSTNGTFVNGENISEAYLKDGDVIFFTEGGPKVSFLTRVGDPMEAMAVPDPPPADPVPQPVAPPVTPQRPVVRQSPVPQPQPVVQPVVQPEVQVETVKAPLIIQFGPVLQSFNELPITIGTKEDCDLTLQHPSLLDHHVQIFFSQGSYRIKDLSGRNQILINNQPIISPAALTPGDKLFLTAEGPAFHFMEGGRMAEITIPQQEAPKDVKITAPQKEENPSNKKNSLFKKFFR